MSCARAWRAFVLCGGYVCGSLRLAQAAAGTPAAAPTENEAPPPLARVEVAALGDAGQDPLLFDRIRSLFPPQTAVIRSEERLLDQRAVLSPRRSDTVYVWIRVTGRDTASVYLTIAEPGQQARHLFREIELDSGLDEVGSETLAGVAHSSARALWLRERQSSREALLEALEREPQIQPEPPRRPEPAPSVVAVGPEPIPADAPVSAHDAAAPRRPPRLLRLDIGATGAIHSSGSEGFLQEVGVFFGLEYRRRLTLRTAARYLLPTSFEVAPARVHLSGAAAEVRAGWLSTDAMTVRIRLEAGLGALLGRARATIVDEQPKAHALAGRAIHRGYALAAAGVEWPLGPAWIATSVDLRVPFATTAYEVAGQPNALTSAAISPGGSLEVGFGFDAASR